MVQPHAAQVLVAYQRGGRVPRLPAHADNESRSGTLHWIVIVHHKGYIPWGETALPDTFGGTPVKLYNGRLRALPEDEFNYSRPDGPIDMLDLIQPGCSIGELNGHQIGTLGCFLSSTRTAGVDFLTNWHVLPRSTTVVQPAMGDFRRAEVRLHKGRIVNAKRLKPEGWRRDVAEGEVALAELTAPHYHWTEERPIRPSSA